MENIREYFKTMAVDCTTAVTSRQWHYGSFSTCLNYFLLKNLYIHKSTFISRYIKRIAPDIPKF